MLHPAASAFMILGLIPAAHYLLIQSQVHPTTTVLLSLGFMTLPSILFPCNDQYIGTVLNVFAWFVFVLRALEIPSFDRYNVKKWSYFDYLEFVSTSSNSLLRLQQHESTKGHKDHHALTAKKSYIDAVTVLPNDRTLSYFANVVAKLVLTYVAYAFALVYFRKYGYEERKGLLDFKDTKGVIEHSVFGVLLYGTVELYFHLLFFPLILVLNAPFVPVFNAPYRATSVRDFWSRRWNLFVKEILHTIGFGWTRRLLTSKDATGKDRHNAKKVILSSLAAFGMSSLLHEYFIFMLTNETLFGENTLFFMAHGILCVLQVEIQRYTGFGRTWGTGLIWNVLGWFATMTVLLFTSPLFVAPFGRSQIVLSVALPIPAILFDLCYRLI
ncbi:hypothetical protein BDR26DRAFT_870080 [Obelidium mucronatum]|nr:hypothetical protein BDR26DRAFT_870080 [Obelidium mucronatum]